MENINASIHDFSLVKGKVDKIKNELNLKKSSDAFYHFILDLFLNLQEDEINESITDKSYLQDNLKTSSNHDRGLDAIYIEKNKEKKYTVHLFNFKYTEKFEKTNGFFPSSEIDIVFSILHSFFSKNNSLKSSVNEKIFDKFNEIYRLYDEGFEIKYKLYFVSNIYKGLEKNEEKRFLEGLNNFSHLEFEYILLENIIKLLLNKNKINVNAKIRLIDDKFFETGTGNVNALIAQVDIRELFKCIIDEESSRLNVTNNNYDFLLQSKILPDSFENNVRLYLKQKTNINRNIKNTALDEEDNKNIFYYNNGITITCSDFSYSSMRSPILDLTNLQIVNGGQTIRSLFEAFQENQRIFKKVDILCKIYKTQNKELSVKISEYTNSQNPVISRDIRSIDLKQIKLEEDFKTLGYYYERKKNQHEDKEKSLRIDSEKAGQVILAYYCENPAFAKNRKSVIFGDEYENVFPESILAKEILFVLKLFEKIEFKKKETLALISNETLKYDEFSFINYASYYALFFFKKIAEVAKIKEEISNLDLIFNNYENVIKIIKYLIQKEKERLGDKYNDGYYFKSNRLKTDYIKNESELKKIFLDENELKT